MRTTSGRIFSTVTIILLVSLLFVGLLLRSQIEDYLTDHTFDRLQHDIVCLRHDAATAYSIQS